MILRALWLRPMLARPARTLATVAGVAIGVASVVSTVLASRAAVASMGADVERIAGRAALEVTRPGGVETEDLGALRGVAGELVAAPVVEGTALAPGLGDLVRVLGVDLLVDAAARDVELDPGPARGSGRKHGQDDAERLETARKTMLHGNGVAATRALADALGLEVGDPLPLVVRTHRVELELAAILQPARFASAWDRTLFVDVALAQELLGRGGRLDRVELIPRSGALDESALDALAAELRAALPPGHRVGRASDRRAEGERMVRALDFNLTALAGVSVLVAVVLVATTLATSVVQRRAHVALLRSLGASRAQLARAVLAEAAAIGLAGGGLGVLAGWLGARAAVASVRATVSTLAEDVLPGRIELEPAWILLGVALGLASATAAAVLPLREALRTPPVQNLRSESPESVARRAWKARLAAALALSAGAAVFVALPPLGDRPVWALLAALLLLATLLVLSAPLIDLFAGLRVGSLRSRVGLPLRLAQAAVEAGRRRAAWAAGAVGVAVGLAVAMTAMVGSFRTTVVDWTSQTMRSDLFVRPLATDAGTSAGRLDPEVVRVVRDVLGAENVDPFHQSAAYVGERRFALAGAAFSVVAREGGVPFLDGRPSTEVFGDALARGAAVVNEPFARRFGVAAGDRIEVRTAAGPVTREIAGVYRDYSGHTGRMVLDLADFLSLYPDEGPESVAVFVPGGDVEGARAALTAALAGRFAVEVLNNREIRAEVMAVFERTFAVTVALQLVASLVAGIAVVTVLGALVRERRRDLAVLRVLGGSRRQLVSVVLAQALLLGLAGALGGLVVGLVVGWVLVAVVNVQSFGWSLRFAPPPSLLGAALAVLPACLLAGLVPALLTLRRSPHEVLRESA